MSQDKIISKIKENLITEIFNNYWEEGKILTLDEASNLALSINTTSLKINDECAIFEYSSNLNDISKHFTKPN